MDEFRRRLMSTPRTVKTDYDNYLTIEALEDGLQVSFTNTIYYNKDGEWVLLGTNNATPSISTGEKISFKAELTPGKGGVGTFTITKKCNLLGNCMSLLFGDNANEEVSLLGYDRAFYQLFKSCSTIINVSKNFLPATTLSSHCYYEMFGNCSNMISPPELPAMTLADNCYNTMFRSCLNLINAPELPATNVNQNCYRDMFSGCTSLETASKLPAMTLASSCYYKMFYGCTSLVNAPELPATNLTIYCYTQMFQNCTSLKTAPELPATTLVNNCYYYMFNGCRKLNYIKMLATDVSASNCLGNWVSNVASTGTFVKSKGATWDITGSSGIPSGWTVKTA